VGDLHSLPQRPLAPHVDDKGKLVLPPVPKSEPAELCKWLTAVLALDPEHPITEGVMAGVRGPNAHVVLRRLDAPPLAFEPAARINTPMRLVEDRSWQAIPSAGEVPPFKGAHCMQIAYVVRQLCGISQARTDEQETIGIVYSHLSRGIQVEGHTTYGSSAQRYEAVLALRDDPSGRRIGGLAYLIDAHTGELVIRVSDLETTARLHIGSSLSRGWLTARMELIGWTRCTIDGHAQPGRVGRQGPHARTHVYRGLLPQSDDDGAVTTGPHVSTP